MRSCADEGEEGEATEAARLLLDEAGLPAYLMHVELEGAAALLVVDRPARGAWRRVVVRTEIEPLLATLDDPARRAELAARVKALLARRDAA